MLLSGSFCLYLASYELLKGFSSLLLSRNFPNITFLSQRFCLHRAPVCHPGARGEEPDFLHNCSPSPCHASARVRPSTPAFWPLSQGVSLWQIGLSCFFLGGLHNPAPLENLKQGGFMVFFQIVRIHVREITSISDEPESWGLGEAKHRVAAWGSNPSRVDSLWVSVLHGRCHQAKDILPSCMVRPAADAV